MDAAASAGQSLTLTDLFRAWHRRWRTLAAGLVVGAALGAAGNLVPPDSFEAVTIVQVESADPDLVDMAAEEAVATSRRVTAEALDALDDTSLTIEGLEAAATARVVGNSRVLRVTFSAATPRTAAQGADALAQAYLAARAVDAADAEISAARPTGRVVDPARMPTAPSGPNIAMLMLAGAVVGLGVAAPVAARPTTRSQAARAS